MVNKKRFCVFLLNAFENIFFLWCSPPSPPLAAHASCSSLCSFQRSFARACPAFCIGAVELMLVSTLGEAAQLTVLEPAVLSQETTMQSVHDKNKTTSNCTCTCVASLSLLFCFGPTPSPGSPGRPNDPDWD